MLRATAEDMQSGQSYAQQTSKSKGQGGAGGEESDRLNQAWALHGVARMGESAARRVSGSIGLGLYIVREIVVAHGGMVEVASTTETGTTFTVRLPRSQPVAANPQ